MVLQQVTARLINVTLLNEKINLVSCPIMETLNNIQLFYGEIQHLGN